MKFAIVLLVLLGIVAAGAATMFIQSMSLFQSKGPATFDVLVAVGDLPARAPLTEAMVEVKKMPKTGLPADFLSDWSQAAGRTLKLAVVNGQPLAASQFVPKESIDDLLKPGMLAFPAPMGARTTPIGLLYPGCIVDVFATFPLRDRVKGDAVVTPLLQNIRVLAIADQTVIPTPQKKSLTADMGKTTTKTSGNVTVTLEVTARQAAALQLAMEKGTLGLAMRNPNDKGWNPMEPMVVKEGQLTAASEALDPQTLAWVRSFQRVLNLDTLVDANTPQQTKTPQPVAKAPDPSATPVAPQPSRPDGYVGMPTQKQKSAWSVEIIRGQKKEKAEIEQPGAEKAKEETDAGTEN